MRRDHPDWWNAPVPAFGDPDAWLAIVGLAPGVNGANRTGRPFTGDAAGGLLYQTLAKFGLSEGAFDGRPDDGLVLKGAIVINAATSRPRRRRIAVAAISPRRSRRCVPRGCSSRWGRSRINRR